MRRDISHTVHATVGRLRERGAAGSEAWAERHRDDSGGAAERGHCVLQRGLWPTSASSLEHRIVQAQRERYVAKRGSLQTSGAVRSKARPPKEQLLRPHALRAWPCTKRILARPSGCTQGK